MKTARNGNGRLSDEEYSRIKTRIAQDNAERALSGEAHNRRRPVASSVVVSSLPQRGATDADGNVFNGLPPNRLAVNAADDVVLASGNTNAERAVGGNHIKTSSIGDAHVNGRFGAGVLPTNTNFGKRNSKTDIDWRNRSVPDGALSRDYADAKSVATIKQQVSGFQNQIQGLKRQIKQLQQGRKKKSN